jgi:sugar/nucleoside kinase (ribokinase family)
MSITVVGSIAFDAVETPFGQRDRMLGGAATHFALAASFFDEVHLVGPVGDDFGADEFAVLGTRGSNIEDVERVNGGRTFFWKGKYGWDLNSREALDTQLNVFDVIREVDCVILNDAELRQLTGRPNLVSAASEVISWGPSVVVAKLGEYGAALITRDIFFALPAYPLESVVDPTGAGDTFAGGFVGYLARHLRNFKLTHVLRNAMAYGTALASFNVEQLGTEGLIELDADAVRHRVHDLWRCTHFDLDVFAFAAEGGRLKAPVTEQPPTLMEM